jgi:hypothetical protein
MIGIFYRKPLMDNFTREKLPHLYYDVFDRNPAGVAILDHLWSQFVDTQAKQPLDALDLAFREGQRSVIRFIQLNRDRLSRELQPSGE